MIIEIISIGDEILSGNILDTNKQYLSDALWQRGFKVRYQTSVCDDEADIRDALLCASQRAGVVICTGGLGPTDDDFTIEVAAKTFGVELEQDQNTFDYLTGLYQKRGRELKANNIKQAFIPKGGRVLMNRVGTAPGVFYEFRGVLFYFLPGVPAEMKSIFETQLLSELKALCGENLFFESVFLKTFGCPESELDSRISDLYTGRTEIENVRVGFRAQFAETMIKLSTWNNDKEQAHKDLQRIKGLVCGRVGEFVYTEDPDMTLERLLVERCRQKKLTVAVAESCTGGLVADRITNISGASAVFKGGVVAYSNELKQTVLKVPQKILDEQGAVSAACAEAMVRGLKELTNADLCAAVTGIAGPTGGTKDKPVGTVHIAFLLGTELKQDQYFLNFGRELFKRYVSSVAIRGLVALCFK